MHESRNPASGPSNESDGVSFKGKRPWLVWRSANDRGVALIVVLLSMTLLLALGGTLVLTATLETRIPANYRDGAETFYAADAAIDRAIQDLAFQPDWNGILAGTTRSTFVDGPPGGTRTVAGTTLDLGERTSLVRCGKRGPCTDDEMNASTEDRPWGRNNPRWQLYAYGPVKTLPSQPPTESPVYVVVWVADDPSETDGDWLTDGGPPAGDPDGDNPGRGVLSVLAHAYGSGGIRRIVRVTVSRTDAGNEDDAAPQPVRIVAWREQ